MEQLEKKKIWRILKSFFGEVSEISVLNTGRNSEGILYLFF